MGRDGLVGCFDVTLSVAEFFGLVFQVSEWFCYRGGAGGLTGGAGRT